jgi:hypothetical protein
MLQVSEYTVDIDELWATANKVLGVSDVVQALSGRASMHHAGSFGGALAGAADRWGFRYRHLLAEIAEQVEHRGYVLRGNADAYFEVELTVRDRLRALAQPRSAQGFEL